MDKWQVASEDRRRNVKKKWIILGALAVSSLLFVGVTLANGTPSIDWWGIGGGGGSGTVGSTSLGGTIGQWVVGSDTTGTTQLCSGFWCGAVGEYRVFLPLVLRQG
jgi:hypothetical protein